MPKGQRACIDVRPVDAATLRMWARSRRGERRLAERAQVILLSSAGASVAEISRRTGPSPQGCFMTPTYASWLNQVEIWLSIFARDVIKGAMWRSKAELIRQIMEYIRIYSSERARSFTGTYTGKPLAA